MTAPTTHWSTTGRLHTGTVEGCGACEWDGWPSPGRDYWLDIEDSELPSEPLGDAPVVRHESHKTAPLAPEQVAEGKSHVCSSERRSGTES